MPNFVPLPKFLMGKPWQKELKIPLFGRGASQNPSAFLFSKTENTCSRPMFQDHDGAKTMGLHASGAKIVGAFKATRQSINDPSH